MIGINCIVLLSVAQLSSLFSSMPYLIMNYSMPFLIMN